MFVREPTGPSALETASEASCFEGFTLSKAQGRRAPVTPTSVILQAKTTLLRVNLTESDVQRRRSLQKKRKFGGRKNEKKTQVPVCGQVEHGYVSRRSDIRKRKRSAMAFSGALTLTDLNDYITPSQACIKPVETKNTPAGEGDAGAASTQIHVDRDGSYYEVTSGSTGSKSNGGGRRLEAAQVSLNDCLACSGCITSAESVLITMQSHFQVLDFLTENATHDPTSPQRKLPVVSIAPQTLASLAASVSASFTTPVTSRQIFLRVEAFFNKSLGIDYVYDTTFARHVSLLEHSREFFERKAQSTNGMKSALPMLASACPGWICYAEKTHSEMLPFISRTKSPQQAMGTIVKAWLASKWNKNPDQIYHVTVMPCYDKKLEASRQDFYNEVFSTRDVDCVITTGELELLMKEKSWDISVPVANELAHTPLCTSPAKPRVDTGTALPQQILHPGTSSGSYLHTIIDAIRSRHRFDAPQRDSSDLELSVKALRSADYEEYTLTDKSTGKVVFKGAKCYGFRNLQNVVRRVGKEAGVQTGRGAAGRLTGSRSRAVKKAATAGEDANLDYVEVMACPGGCINGGGQLKRTEPTKVDLGDKDSEGYGRDWRETGVDPASALGARWGDKEWTKEVERMYWAEQGSDIPMHPGLNVFAVNMLHEMCGYDVTSGLSWSDPMDEKAETRRRSLFRTEYRAVESEIDGLLVKW